MEGGASIAAAIAGVPARTAPRVAIIDIGSNSIRLVVYEGLTRTPSVLFNEKVMAGLGRGVLPGGRLSDEAMAVALAALARFALLCRAMEVDSLRAVATAAVRDAANGATFVARIGEETGIAVEVIAGEMEATGAAWGVIAGIPEADGVVGDLGGGSLELVRVADGQVHERLSLPLGALRLDDLRKRNRRALGAIIERALAPLDWARLGVGKPFYAVGGSWRALAQLHMHLTGWPLPVVHQYAMPADAPDRLVRTLARMSLRTLKDVPAISGSRIPHLPGAAIMLRAVTRAFGSSTIVASAYGLREGLIYGALAPEARAADPLLTAARYMAERTGRFSDGSDADAGEALDGFLAPLFAADPPALARIREAACLLADSAWRAHPDMRAEHGMDLALHGNWVGIDAAGRAMLAAALYGANGGALESEGSPLALLARLAPAAMLERARQWGLAIRLGQRLGGGAAGPLADAALAAGDGRLWLSLVPAAEPLYGEAVARRHRALALALGLEPALRLALPAAASSPRRAA
jgi:exopolyphosphatase/guanosine-5'-triphosphate,3'-diphosphate pyrophosphatase